MSIGDLMRQLGAEMLANEEDQRHFLEAARTFLRYDITLPKATRTKQAKVDLADLHARENFTEALRCTACRVLEDPFGKDEDPMFVDRSAAAALILEGLGRVHQKKELHRLTFSLREIGDRLASGTSRQAARSQREND